MKRFFIPLVAFVALAIVFGVELRRAHGTQEVTSALIGKPSPAFELPDLLKPGSTISSASFKGRWHLVNVWGTWCIECRVEHPVLLEIQREGKVAIVGLNYQDDDDAARKWLAELGNPYEAVAVDREGRGAINFGVYGAPENFLVNPQGVIVKKWFGLTADVWNAARKEFIEGAKP